MQIALRALKTGLIHADLIREHLLFDERGHLRGVIDFADSMEGPLEFEAGLFVFNFLIRDRLKQREFLRLCGLENVEPEILLASQMCNRFFHLNHWLGHRLRIRRDFDWIAKGIFTGQSLPH